MLMLMFDVMFDAFFVLLLMMLVLACANFCSFNFSRSSCLAKLD